MAEKWLDQRALKSLKDAENRAAMIIECLDDDVDMEIPVPKPSRCLDDRKLTVALPGTSDVETIKYVAPKIIFDEPDSKGKSVPDFITPEPRFDVFEHFQYEWIAIPEFES